MGIYEELQARGLIAQVTNEPEIREMVNNGRSPIQDDYIEKFMTEWKRGERTLKLRATVDGASAYSDADTIATIRQTFLNHFLRFDLMGGVHTLYECHRLTKDGDVALHDTLNHIGHTDLTTTKAPSLQIRINYRLLCDTGVHLQSFVFFVVFWMFHSKTIKSPWAVSLLFFNLDYNLLLPWVVRNHENTRTGFYP